MTTVASWDLPARVYSLDVGRWEKSDTFLGTRVLRQRMEDKEAGVHHVKGTASAN